MPNIEIIHAPKVSREQQLAGLKDAYGTVIARINRQTVPPDMAEYGSYLAGLQSQRIDTSPAANRLRRGRPF